MYTCDVCNYKTEYSFNLKKHNTTQRHKLKAREKSKEKTSEKSNIRQNIKIRKSQFHDIDSNSKDIIKIYKDVLQLKDDIIREKDQIIRDSSNLVNKTIYTNNLSSIDFVKLRFPNAPPLKSITNFNINNLNLDNKDDISKFANTFIYNARNNMLDKLLGEHIIRNYKKNDLSKQAFYSTDCSRLNYIVSMLIDEADDKNGCGQKSSWEIDKSGIEVCRSLIKPLITKCLDILLEFQHDLFDYMMQSRDCGKEIQNQIEGIISARSKINTGELEISVSRYIAPYFNLKKVKEITE